jgi:hypothetical protein
MMTIAHQRAIAISIFKAYGVFSRRLEDLNQWNALEELSNFRLLGKELDLVLDSMMKIYNNMISLILPKNRNRQMFFRSKIILIS